MNILLVDNDERNLLCLEEALLSEQHTVKKCKDPAAAIEAMVEGETDLIFLAAVLPGASGFETARTIKARRSIPIILLTGLREKDDILQGLESGVDEFLSKPFIREEILLKVRNIAVRKQLHGDLAQLASKRTDHLREVLRKSVELNREMVFRLLAAAEYKDDDTGKHIIRIGKCSRLIAENLGFKGEFLDLIESAAGMHDLGKVGIPDRMLLKSGTLTEREFEIMKSHTVIGASILEGSSFPLINMAHDIALTHHERWDGSGYPDGLKGEKIPISGRIVAIADVFDALISQRPYKPAFSWDKSLIMLKEGAGKQFAPEIVDAFCSRIMDIDRIYREFRDPEIKNCGIDIDDIEKIR